MVLDADHILRRMNHRGACGCEANTGDGAGILTALPHEFLARVAREDLGAELPEPGRFAAGLVFLPTDDSQRQQCKQAVEQIVAQQGSVWSGWRPVPVCPDEADVGPTARRAMPVIEQLFIAAGGDLEGEAFERQLYLIRKRSSHRLRNDASLAARR
jgi:glutamate synthase (NADPH) large chain